MKNVVWCMIVVWAGLSVSGCATIVSGTTQKLSVSSRPIGATATVDGSISAKTPAVLTLDRKNDHTLVVSKDGFKNQTVFIKRTMNGMGFGNALLGGVIGVGIDAASGASNKLVPERVDLVLEEGQGDSARPIFASQKDTDYYEKWILAPELTRQEKEKKNAETKLQKEAARQAGSDTAKTGVTTNFSAKTPAPLPSAS